MPDLTITVTADQAAAVKEALGHWDDSEPPVWVDATADEIKAEIKRLVKRQVFVYRKQKEEGVAVAEVNSSMDAEGWNE